GAEAIQSGSQSSALAVPLVLFAAAAALIVFEAKTGHGFMLFSGVIVGVIATILLVYDIPYSPSPFGTVQYIELGIFIVASALVALYARWVGGSIRRKPVTGVESMIGKSGIATTSLDPDGEVSLDGIVWKAKISEGVVQGRSLAKGTRVKVLRVAALTLEVEPEPIKENAKSHTVG
ncbi:MAG: NfeD family protein, partial [Rhabdochlamydiaceae bacterium]